jgi:hypothetical protein
VANHDSVATRAGGKAIIDEFTPLLDKLRQKTR